MSLTYENYPPLKNMALAAVKAGKTTGYPPIVLLAQWSAESDWGRKVTGDYNFWGIKAVPPAPCNLCPTTEDLTPEEFAEMRADERATVTKIEPLGNGLNRYHMSCWFASYPSFDASVIAYIEFILTNSRYHPAWVQYQATKDTDEFIKGIARAGYATSPEYEQLLLTLANQQNLIHAVAMARES